MRTIVATPVLIALMLVGSSGSSAAQQPPTTSTQDADLIAALDPYVGDPFRPVMSS